MTPAPGRARWPTPRTSSAVTNGSDDAAGSEAPESAQRADETVAEGDDLSGTTVTLLTHDSFNVSPETLEAFTESTGIKVEQLASGDAGVLVAQACLTAGEPLGDVLFGIDNTFLQRGLDCGIFEPYASPGLADVPDHFELDGEHRVTPIDFGDVCLNYWVDSFDGSPPPPSSLDDLIDPAYADMLAVQSPETSSPGLAFLLATIARLRRRLGGLLGRLCGTTACRSPPAGRTPTTGSSSRGAAIARSWCPTRPARLLR